MITRVIRFITLACSASIKTEKTPLGFAILGAQSTIESNRRPRSRNEQSARRREGFGRFARHARRRSAQFMNLRDGNSIVRRRALNLLVPK